MASYHGIKDAVYEMTSARLADEFMAAANGHGRLPDCPRPSRK